MSNIFINKKTNKIFASFFILIFVLSSFLPVFSKKAEAQWIVYDPANHVSNTITAVNTTVSAATDIVQASTGVSRTLKEFLLDAIAYKVLDLIIQRVTASTVNWINSGFRGKPAFVNNPEAFFKEIGDKVAGEFIYRNQNLNFLCGPISARIKIVLSANYTRSADNWRCTLTDVRGNIENFLNDFERGGWDKFFQLTQEQQNNPIGAYIKAEGSLFERIAQKKDTKERDLILGRGFLSKTECVEWIPEGTDANPTFRCAEEVTTTPGSVIETKLNDTLNIGNHKLAVADEINEIISALLNQLINRIVGGIGRGLSGLSRPDTADGGQIFTGQLSTTTKDETIDDYVKKSDRDVQYFSNLPPYQPPSYTPPACGVDPSLPECQPEPLPPIPGPGQTTVTIPPRCDPNTDPNCPSP